MKKITMTIAALAGMLFSGQTVLAAPVVNAVQGTVGNKQAITIQGAGFGQKIPAAPLLWADFESGLNPGPGGAKRVWDQVQSMTWAKGEGYGGGGAAKAVDGSGVWSLRTDYESWTRDGQTLYVYKKERMNFLITDLSQNWKTWRMWPTGNGYPNIYTASNNGRIYVEKVSSSDSGFYGSMKVNTTNWVTQEIIMRASTINQKNGYLKMRHDGRTVAEGSIMTRSSQAPAYMNWNYVLHAVAANHGLWSPGWNNNNRVWADDIYVDNTWSRVMLGNASQLSNCSKLEIQVPTSWSQGSVSVIARTGTFGVGSTAYLYVFDKDGQVNSNGFAVVIGQAGNAVPGDPVPTGPVANAGPDVVAAVGVTTSLNGAVLGSAADAGLSARWTVQSGPGGVTFSNTTSANTTATFESPGQYVLQLEASDGEAKSIDTVSVTAVPSIATSGVQPKNVFNPAGGETYHIVYLLDGPSRLEAEVIDRTGHLVRRLDGGDRPAGEQYLEWDGRNDSGDVVASGIYLVVKRFNGKRSTNKVAVIK